MDATRRKALVAIFAIFGAGLIGAAWLFWNSQENSGVIASMLPVLPERDRRAELASLEAALQGTTDEYARWVQLPRLAHLDARIGNPECAKAHVAEVLALAPKYVTDWNYGNVTHKAHLALGHIALRAGALEIARKELLAAGDTRGSPQLDSFGPSMTLANDLLAKGEREVVLAYIAKLGRFWKDDRGSLNMWTEMIQAGRTPNFGAHLVY
ncbi:hypothetical protein BWI17_21175 [Betaproteobacteria bacterium GR16-43]|nr:hypothetical protein BWI17_21175 [Betaproteobacteria bacterium GR16-43]